MIVMDAGRSRQISAASCKAGFLIATNAQHAANASAPCSTHVAGTRRLLPSQTDCADGLLSSRPPFSAPTTLTNLAWRGASQVAPHRQRLHYKKLSSSLSIALVNSTVFYASIVSRTPAHSAYSDSTSTFVASAGCAVQSASSFFISSPHTHAHTLQRCVCNRNQLQHEKEWRASAWV